MQQTAWPQAWRRFITATDDTTAKQSFSQRRKVNSEVHMGIAREDAEVATTLAQRVPAQSHRCQGLDASANWYHAPARRV
jgi:hypothetical protein